MKSLAVKVPSVRQKFHHFFPAPMQRRLQSEAYPRNYQRKVEPFACIRAFLQAFLLLSPGLRTILLRDAKALGTPHPSTLSLALASPLLLALLKALLQSLAAPPGKHDLVVLDSMGLSLPRTRRHHCEPMNDQTVGGGVLWGLCLTAGRASSPLHLLATKAGAWHDSKLARQAALTPQGPLYIMDQGFYAIDLVARWLKEGVRFLVRARQNNLLYTALSQEKARKGALLLRPTARSKKRRPAAAVLFDGTALLGSEQRAGKRPVVRLLIVVMGKKDKLALVSSELAMEAQRLLDDYGRRWEIEEFHRLLKRTVGLAHLYSFRWAGMQALCLMAALLAVLLWLSDKEEEPGDRAQSLVKTIRQLLREERLRLGIQDPWRPNIIGKTHWRHRA